jgi:hypothetical protein
MRTAPRRLTYSRLALGEPPEAVTDVVVLGEPSAHPGGDQQSRAAQRRIVPWPPNLSSWSEPVGNVRRHRSHLGTGGSRMWKAVKEAIQTTGRTLRFIAIIAVLALVAWIMSPH